MTISSKTFKRYHMTVTVKVMGLIDGYYVVSELRIGNKSSIVDVIEFEQGLFADVCNQVASAHLLVWLQIAKSDGIL